MRGALSAPRAALVCNDRMPPRAVVCGRRGGAHGVDRAPDALVNDLLMLSRLESSQSQEVQQAVPLHGLIQHLCDDVQTHSGDKQQQISLDVPQDARLIGNPAELESAFGNLISNAVKYTLAKSQIWIRYWQDEDGAHFSVSDNGHGIDPTHIPRLTERFYRPDSSRHSESGGTGLGLAIVKHIMIRHQGRLEIKSEIGKGSTFTCHFPLPRLVTDCSGRLITRL